MAARTAYTAQFEIEANKIAAAIRAPCSGEILARLDDSQRAVLLGAIDDAITDKWTPERAAPAILFNLLGMIGEDAACERLLRKILADGGTPPNKMEAAVELGRDNNARSIDVYRTQVMDAIQKSKEWRDAFVERDGGLHVTPLNFYAKTSPQNFNALTDALYKRNVTVKDAAMTHICALAGIDLDHGDEAGFNAKMAALPKRLRAMYFGPWARGP